MTHERWAQVDRVVQAVLARPDHARAAAVTELCAGDDQLRGEVESLLASLAQASIAGFGAPLAYVATARRSLIGRQVGPYNVHALLGVGGMGEVYQAHDSTLGRDVALKILPDLWLADPERHARFDREARLLASLNHPSIGAIYGVHESDDVRALVLELVEGDTLADRLTVHTDGGRRGLPLDDVVSIASQIADALETAHARGIIHRDLKPSNIKITPDGRVKVLDFGLARAVSGEGSSAELANSPTITVGGTHAGVLLGTAPYMSPEQARGRTVDRRTDIWAFGCVLYEMLTGAPAFAGDGISEVLATVIKGEPDWNALPADTPPALRLCLHRCLRKDLRQRFHDIGDVRLAMEGAFELPADLIDGGHRGESLTARAAYAGWMVALVAIAAALTLGTFGARTPADMPETRLDIVTPPAADPYSLAIAPDGRSVVFQGRAEDRSLLWLRSLQSEEARPLAGTDDAINPFWSPDSRSVGFFANGMLKRIDLANGIVRVVASAPNSRRAAWNQDGVIFFGASIGPLYSVPASGGAVKEATSLLAGQTNHRLPHFLPGGRFLLYTLGTPDVRGVYVASLADRSLRRLFERDSAYAFMAPDHVLIARHGALWARRLNLGDAPADGELVAVAPRVLVHSGITGFGSLSTSSVGSIAFRTSAEKRQLVWVDRAGRTVAAPGGPDDAQLDLAGLSPDGRAIAAIRMVNGNTDIWILDAERDLSRRLTFDPATDGMPIFSPDGRRVVYVSDGKADIWDIFERSSDGTGDATLIFESPENKQTLDWSSDGRYILYSSQNLQTDYDLWALPLDGERKPVPVARTPFVEFEAKFSPDGRWVAFDSTEMGRAEVYIQPFPGPGPKVQVSVGGGLRPRWRRDGRELFYVSLDNRMMSVSITHDGQRLDAAPPRALFASSSIAQYEPSPDGQRFLVPTIVSPASPITVILNWKPPGR